MTTEPTDAELWQFYMTLPGASPTGHPDPIATMRAARQRWGQPSGAGEVVAWRYRMKGDLQWQYTERPEQFTHADEVQELTPPQPTQAQAGAVPLTDAQAQELIELESWGPDAIGLNAQLLRTIRRTEAAHGIKGKEAGNAE